MSLTNNFGIQSETISGLSSKFAASEYKQTAEVDFTTGQHVDQSLDATDAKLTTGSNPAMGF